MARRRGGIAQSAGRQTGSDFSTEGVERLEIGLRDDPIAGGGKALAPQLGTKDVPCSGNRRESENRTLLRSLPARYSVGLYGTELRFLLPPARKPLSGRSPGCEGRLDKQSVAGSEGHYIPVASLQSRILARRSPRCVCPLDSAVECTGQAQYCRPWRGTENLPTPSPDFLSGRSSDFLCPLDKGFLLTHISLRYSRRFLWPWG
jgi:hypothetical protein